ncbi:MAG: pyridoxamine 5'-phosphate oxidase family protein [Planctomycetaceae bacterium]|nr:pyridoxamine 5'-phosphate oxidase family protein [Planctomycetaceae bacterium]
MNLDDVKLFIKPITWGMLATSDGRKVGVRPMSGLAWNGSQLWCATLASSDKVAQVKRVPQAEYCFCDASGKHVRIAGPCTISTDNAEKLWLWNAVPMLKDYIPDPAATSYVVIKMIPDNIRITNPNFTYTQVEL